MGKIQKSRSREAWWFALILLFAFLLFFFAPAVREGSGFVKNEFFSQEILFVTVGELFFFLVLLCFLLSGMAISRVLTEGNNPINSKYIVNKQSDFIVPILGDRSGIEKKGAAIRFMLPDGRDAIFLHVPDKNNTFTRVSRNEFRKKLAKYDLRDSGDSFYYTTSISGDHIIEVV